MANNYNQNYDNSDVFFDVYAAEGDMQPEEMALRRKQAQIDALRAQGMQAQEGKMVGNTFVAPSFAQYAAQLGNAYMGRKGQEQSDVKEKELGLRRGDILRGASATIRGRMETPDEIAKRKLMESLAGGNG